MVFMSLFCCVGDNFLEAWFLVECREGEKNKKIDY